ncbi:hypothetical protein DVR12_16565 [Chitinophaga silvatica]|uniref:Uncharacterized protein n=1 Tax=Chitinophaga silvatica TaxID=2282649 RepID=A0A3E1Y7C9_9BACT|nr:hypothetical protein [Chitinophaga silvatica]RFS20964.1 hypothetical protein DVR12_16565 [Chitinophaga silvatica]
MSKSFISPTFILLSLLFFVSCIKDPTPVVHQLRLSQLNVKSIYEGKVMEYDTFRLTYNSYGDPVEVRPDAISTGTPRIVIGYDNQRRIKAVIYAYTGNGFYESHNYKYDEGKKLITDSVRYFGDFDPVTFEVISTHIPLAFENKLTFDNQQRIVKIVQTPYVFTYDGYSTITYTYNSSGNVSKITTAITSPSQGNSSTDRYPVYDTKINPHRLHAAWQLIDYDYNRNNCVKVDSYNKQGLPVLMDYTDWTLSMNKFQFLKLAGNYNELIYE